MMDRFRDRRCSVMAAVFLSLVFVCLSLPSRGGCESAKQLYFKAESCYQKLSGNPSRQKYRSYWKECIRKFARVHQADPSGPWAPAGLYMTAALYAELHRHSGSAGDIQAARARYARVISDYPDSKYRQRALGALKNLPAPETRAREIYFEAEAAWQELRKHPHRQKYRSYWKKCIEAFEKVYRYYPGDEWAPAAMFMSGRLYEKLYAKSFNQEDRAAAAEIYKRLIETYPDSQYRERARQRQNEMRDIIGGAIAGAQEEEKQARRDTSRVSAQADAAAAGERATVTGIRYWSNPDYTRVVIDASRETGFQNHLLKKDPSIKKPYPRLYVDLENARLGEVEKKIPINDSLLRTARAGQYDRDTVRVVVDLKSFADYNIFSLKNPFRIVMDIRGEGKAEAVASHSTRSRPSDPILTPLHLGVKRIVIDPGHGGKDYGAPGYTPGVHEKDVVLSISKMLAERLRKELGCEVLMTRKTDTYLTLEERTAIANTEKADLFLSIHANAARNHRAFGIETYFLNLTTDESAISVAARENATSEKNIGELDSILQDLLNNAKINESSRLAAYVQKSLCAHLDGRYSSINNKGVKQAPFYVLLGAQMPSILIETSFISNQRECRRLVDPDYQADVCDGILEGVRRYINEMQPKATFGPEPAADAQG